MKYYGIDSIGEIKIEYVDTLPTWNNDYNRRIVLNYADGHMYFGYYKWVKITNYSDVIDAINHVDLTNNPHNVTTDQINAATKPELNDHITDYTDPHQTLGDYQGPGYIVYYTNTNQSSFDAYRPVAFDSVNDSYNVNNRIVANANKDTFTLQRGYYIINFRIWFIEIDSGASPEPQAIVYNKTTGAYLGYTQVITELNDSIQGTTQSFSFPLFVSTETELQLSHRCSSSQKGQISNATIIFEAPIAVENY